MPCADHSKCYPEEKRCNGRYLCRDRLDEANCTACKGKNIIWFHEQKMCLSANVICDGFQQIPGGEDEANCDVCPDDRPFKCGSSSTTCITKSGICISITDCLDGTDENCPLTSQDEYTCQGKLFHNEDVNILCPDEKACMTDEKVCDGHRDCSDGRDELFCEINRWRSRRFHCENSTKWLLTSKQCDGVPDCPLHFSYLESL